MFLRGCEAMLHILCLVGQMCQLLRLVNCRMSMCAHICSCNVCLRAHISSSFGGGPYLRNFSSNEGGLFVLQLARAFVCILDMWLFYFSFCLISAHSHRNNL